MLLGAPAFMQLDALNRVLHELNRLSAAYLRIDSLKSRMIYPTLKDMPAVAGVSLKNGARVASQSQARANFAMTMLYTKEIPCS